MYITSRSAGHLVTLLFCWLPALVAQANERFDILEYRVEGNTVLPALAIEEAVYPHLGEKRVFNDVEAARSSLEKAYHEAGYLTVSVNVPEQRVMGGMVRLRVLEGQVERLRVVGSRYYSLGEIKAATPALAEESVPHFPDVQKQLAEANRSAERRIIPVLRPGRAPGKVEVELKVEDQHPLHGNIEINNKQSPDTSELRLEAGLHYDNLFQKQHSLNLNYILSPEQTDEVNVVTGFYTAPLARGRSLTAYAVHSESNVTSVSDTTVLGTGNVLGLRYTLPLPTRRASSGFFHSLTLGADFKDFSETRAPLGADQEVSPVTYLPLSAQYTLGQAGEDRTWFGNLNATFNLRGLLDEDLICPNYAAPVDQFTCRRAGARPDFFHLRGDLTYTRDWASWRGRLNLGFQVASQPLISNEQFLAGGNDTVRGYYEGEAAGDYGWRLGGEIRSPSLAQTSLGNLYGLGFVEGASLGLNDAPAGQTDSFRLASAGLGLRLEGGKGVRFGLDVAHALRAGPRTASGDDRAHVRLGYQF